ncbi:MAG: hypothetical protein SFW65_02100 [Alphaproteobacteria bacterium]|nr:hypothetical protein [Alphaproteobacteria bacterium]
MTPGCMRGIGDVGAFCALHEEGISQQFSGYFGISVGAVEILFADDPTRGLGIFSKLTGHNFVKLSQQDLTLRSRQLLSAATLRAFQVVGTAATSKLAEITGYDAVRVGAYLDNQYLSRILQTEFVPDIDAIRASEKEYRVYYTNARTGRPQSFDLRKAKTLDEALLHVDASSRLPFISGKPIMIGGDLLFDGCYSASYPVHDITERGYNRIVMMLSLHPDDIMESEGEIGRLVDLYARVHARTSVNAYAEYRAKLPEIINEVMSGTITTNTGTSHIRVIHPEKADSKMNPLETDPGKLEEVFWEGYARGKMFVAQIMREYKQHSDYTSRLANALGFNNAPVTTVKRLAQG